MKNEISGSLVLMSMPNEKYQIARMFIVIAKALESIKVNPNNLDEKVYDNVSIKFDYHGANSDSIDLEKKAIEIGKFFVDMTAITSTKINSSGTKSIDMERAAIHNYRQHDNLEEFFTGATAEQISAIKRLGEKIKHPSPKSVYSKNKRYGSSYIELKRNDETGKYDLVTSANYHDGNRYEFRDFGGVLYETDQLFVDDKPDLKGRSVADIPPAELEQIIFDSYASLADKTDDRLKRANGKVLSIEEQIKRGYAPKLTLAEKSNKKTIKLNNTKISDASAETVRPLISRLTGSLKNLTALKANQANIKTGRESKD